MSDYLYLLPDAAIVILFTLASMAVMATLGQIRRHVPFFQQPRTSDEIKKTDDFLIGIRATLIGMCSLVLAFSLVTVIGNYNRAEAAAAAEASLINNMDRMMARYGDATASELRDELLAYTQSIVEDEWPMLSLGHGSEKTRELFVPISKGVIAIQPGQGRQSVIYTEMVKKADDIAEAREARIESTATSLATVFWLMVALTFSAVIVLTVFVDLSPIRVFGFAIQMAAFAALLSVVFIFDEPFNGQTSVSPKAFVKVIGAMQGRSQ
jgi:hypothetical protein